VDHHSATLRPKAGCSLHSQQSCLGCGKFSLARGKLRRQQRELRLKMGAQILDCCLEPVVGGNLLCLASLHSLEVGYYNVSKDLGKSGKGIVHEGILSKNSWFRMITGARALVMAAWVTLC